MPMFASLADDLRHWLTSPVALAFAAFQIWMLVDAVRRKEWMWVFFLLVFPGFATFWYFFYIYRDSPSATRGFELPGAHDRKRIQELQAQIHHLDKAHHYSQLGDIYFQQGKLDKAESCYRSALERDPQDIDTRAHFGQCLLRQNKAQEARPLLEGVISENPKHEYGYSLMALAETLAALGETDSAIATWRRVTENHHYARARVQLAQLLVGKGEKDAARVELNEVLADFPHAPAFQRKRDRVWVKRARKLMKQVD
jgi:tetratricopeptide (TPR) repeat protein